MDAHNSYEACATHRNGHASFCKDCEIDALRGEVRRLREENAGLQGAQQTLDKAIEMINGMSNKEGGR